MPRVPSIHINKDELVKIFNQLHIECDVDLFMRLAFKKRLTGRQSIFVDSKTRAKSLQNEQRRDSANVELFRMVLYDQMEKARLRGLQVVPGMSDYVLIENAARDAEDFANLFEFGHKPGFTEYVNTAIKVMGKKFSIKKLPYYKSRIFDDFEFRLVVEFDDNVVETKKFADIYISKVLRNTQININTFKNYNVYFNFVYGRLEADESGADYNDWIDAQFEGLAFLDSIPEPNQLYGEFSRKRFMSYTLKHIITRKQTVVESDYFKSLREKRAVK